MYLVSPFYRSRKLIKEKRSYKIQKSRRHRMNCNQEQSERDLFSHSFSFFPSHITNKRPEASNRSI